MQNTKKAKDHFLTAVSFRVLKLDTPKPYDKPMRTASQLQGENPSVQCLKVG